MGEEVEGARRSLWVMDGSLDFKGKPACTAKTGGWKTSLFIMTVELTERIATLAIVSNMITYLTNVLHQGIAFSAKNINNWSGVAAVLPLIGGFLADSYVGGYWMVVVSSIIYVLGLGLLTVVVSLPSLKPSPCPPKGLVYCGNASSAQTGLLFFALYIISVGEGGHKPSLGSFGPDQFDEQNPKEKLQKNSFFNWVFVARSCGTLFATTVVVYVQENVSWGAGFGLVTAAFALSIVVFLCGTPIYRHKSPGGSPITRIAQVFVAAVRNRHLDLPLDAAILHQDSDTNGRHLEHTEGLRWLDKAAIHEGAASINSERTEANPWQLCTVAQIEEAKQILRIIPIWLNCLTFVIVLKQKGTFFVKQSSTMDRKISSNFKLPQASVFACGVLSNMLFLPLYDRVLVPATRRITGNERGITILQRLGVGLIVSILSLIVAALVEVKRLKTAKMNGLLEKPHTAIPLSVFWLAPQYILLGIAEAFTLVAMQEYFYSEMSDTTRSLGIGIFLSVFGVGSFLCSILITVVEKISEKVASSWFVDNLNKCHLDYFFWLLALLSAINFCIFVYVAGRYRYKKVVGRMSQSNRESHESVERQKGVGCQETITVT